MKIAFYGSSLLSAYWNGAATYYRGLLRQLARLGHHIIFYEPDAFGRQAHRDIDPPAWAEVVVWPATEDGAAAVAARAAEAEVVVKASGVGVFDDRLLASVMAAARPGALRLFWDVDAPATLAELRATPDHPLRRLLPTLDAVLTYGGGPPVVRAYRELGARACRPIYNGLDPDTHHPAAPAARFAADLNLLANRLPDREARIEQFFLAPAARLSDRRFLLGGAGWHDRSIPGNVEAIGHVATADHNVFNASALAVLNVARDSMAEVGFSPATRVFEAAGAGACLITDAWDGVRSVLRAGRGNSRRSRWPGGRRAVGGAHARARPRHRRGGAPPGCRRAHLRRPRGRGRPPAARGSRRETARRSGVRLVVLGLSLSSAWGNGHATTYRALLRAFAARGHEVLFLERDTPWYAAHRDLPEPDFCRLEVYDGLAGLERWRGELRRAEAVIVGSYVPEGVAAARLAFAAAKGVRALYDIDTPVTLAKLAAGDFEYFAPETIRACDLYLSFTGGPTLARIEHEFGAPSARALYCSVDDGVYRPLQAASRWDLSYLGTYSADRQPTLERLLIEPARRAPSLRFCVAGPQYPAEIVWPANVERIEHVAPADHPAFYAASRLTLNVTRADMIAAGFSPSVRLFEAAACATPIVSDVWRGLETIFQSGREIVLASESDEVLAALALPPNVAESIGHAARGRVLAAHTASHRAAELEHHLMGTGDRLSRAA